MQHFQLFGGTLAGAAGPSDSDTLMQTFMQDQSGLAMHCSLHVNVACMPLNSSIQVGVLCLLTPTLPANVPHCSEGRLLCPAKQLAAQAWSGVC